MKGVKNETVKAMILPGFAAQMKEQSHLEQSSVKLRSCTKSTERVQSENNLQKQIVAFQFVDSTKPCNMNKTGRQTG